MIRRCSAAIASPSSTRPVPGDDEVRLGRGDRVAVDYTVLRPLPSFRVLVTLTDTEGNTVLRTETIDDPEVKTRLDPGGYRSQVISRGSCSETRGST